MTRVLAPNIFITTNLDVINASFFGKTKYSNLNLLKQDLDSLGLQDYLITSPGNNSNLVEFKYSFGGGKENPDQKMFSFKFLDHAYNLENSFLNKNYQLDVWEKLVTSAVIEYKDTDNSATKKTLQNTINESLVVPNQIFFAFGLGEHLDSWSGPFCGILVGSNVDLTDGNRVVTLNFVGTGGALLTNTLISGEIGGLELAVNRFSKLQFLNQRIQYQIEVEVSKNKLMFKPYRYVKYLFDNYLAQMGKTPNVIFILPVDFKKELNSFIQKDITRKINFNKRFNSIPNKLNPSIHTFSVEDIEDATDTLERFFKLWGFQLFKRLTTTGKKYASYSNSITEIGVETDEKISDNLILQIRVDKYMTQRINDKGELNSIPDPFFALNKLKQIIQNNVLKEHNFGGRTNGGRDTEMIFQEETNLQILKLWKKYGFIKDDTNSCLIYAPQDVIKNYLYPDSIELPTLEIQNPLDIIYANAEYRKEFISLFSRNKSQSSFQEQLIPFGDELSLDNKLKIIEKKAWNIPIFKFNTTNPNVSQLRITDQNIYSLVLNSSYIRKSKIVAANLGVPFLAEDNKGIFKDTFLENLQNKVTSGVGSVSSLSEFQVTFKKLREDIRVYISQVRKVNPQVIFDGKLQNTYYIDSFSFYNDPDVFANLGSNYVSEGEVTLYDATYSEIETSLAEETARLNTLQSKSYSWVDPDYLDTQYKDHLLQQLSQMRRSPQGQKIKHYKDTLAANKSLTLDAYSNILASILWERINRNNQPQIFVDTDKDRADTMMKFEQELQKMGSWQLSLRTLPFFHIDMWDLSKYCYVVAINNKLVGTDTSPRSAYFSGLYALTGFTHIINASECYSEFSMIKTQETDAARLLQ